jgi:hypothetical protein
MAPSRAGAGRPDAPLAWLSMEPGADQAEVHLTIWPGGERRLIAQAGFHGRDGKVLSTWHRWRSSVQEGALPGVGTVSC